MAKVSSIRWQGVLLLVCLAGLLAPTQCGRPRFAAPKPVVSKLIRQLEEQGFKSFVHALIFTGAVVDLEKMLEEGPVTILAPEDSAFPTAQEVRQSAGQRVMPTLKEVILHHIKRGRQSTVSGVGGVKPATIASGLGREDTVAMVGARAASTSSVESSDVHVVKEGIFYDGTNVVAHHVSGLIMH